MRLALDWSVHLPVQVKLALVKVLDLRRSDHNDQYRAINNRMMFINLNTLMSDD